MIAHVGCGAIVKCHKSGAQSVKNCHYKARDSGDEGGVFSKGRGEGDHEGDNKSDAACNDLGKKDTMSCG